MATTTDALRHRDATLTANIFADILECSPSVFFFFSYARLSCLSQIFQSNIPQRSHVNRATTDVQQFIRFRRLRRVCIMYLPTVRPERNGVYRFKHRLVNRFNVLRVEREQLSS